MCDMIGYYHLLCGTKLVRLFGNVIPSSISYTSTMLIISTVISHVAKEWKVVHK